MVSEYKWTLILGEPSIEYDEKGRAHVPLPRHHGIAWALGQRALLLLKRSLEASPVLFGASILVWRRSGAVPSLPSERFIQEPLRNWGVETWLEPLCPPFFNEALPTPSLPHPLHHPLVIHPIGYWVPGLITSKANTHMNDREKNAKVDAEINF